MSSCVLCPRKCLGDRRKKTGFCGGGERAELSKAQLHFWEEPSISGKNGSGTVFFTGCALQCIYCQNRNISRHGARGSPLSTTELSDLFFTLAEQGAHNINLVTAGHYIPQVAEALAFKALPIPVVYNCGGYESVEAIKMLKGLVQIYLPDFKYAQNDLGMAFSGVSDYREVALAAITEMRKQISEDVFNKDGVLQQGLIIRHLILPLHTQNSIEALGIISQNFPVTMLSLMAQYTPVLDKLEEAARLYPELLRGITKRELNKVEEEMIRLNIPGYVQNRSAKGREFIPDF